MHILGSCTETMKKKSTCASMCIKCTFIDHKKRAHVHKIRKNATKKPTNSEKNYAQITILVRLFCRMHGGFFPNLSAFWWLFYGFLNAHLCTFMHMYAHLCAVFAHKHKMCINLRIYVREFPWRGIN